MIARVEKTKGGFAIFLTAETAEALQVKDGAAVEVLPVGAQPGVRYASTEEAMQVFYDTLPQHEATYRELAKS